MATVLRDRIPRVGGRTIYTGQFILLAGNYTPLRGPLAYLFGVINILIGVATTILAAKAVLGL